MNKKLLSITFSILFIVSCGGGGGGGGSTPTTPTTPIPTVNLSAEPTSVVLESTSTLTWSSTNATSCSASWTSQTGTSGSEAVTISTAGNNSFSISCTGDGGTRSASVTVEGYRNTDGVVVDGYISGAEVCIDEDESWTCDSNENSTTSDNEGKFTIRYANGNLVSIGGTDLDSQTLLDNLLITHKLAGHSDFKAVTPVTSVAAFMEDASLVNAALGIDSSIDVFTFDPVANKGDGGINDYLYEKGNQLTVLAYALQNITNNINTTTEKTQDYFRAITEEIEKEYTETETKVDIETEAFITKTLDNVIAAKSATIDETAKTNTTKALASVLPVIQVKESDDTTTALIRFAVSTLQTDIQAIANGTATAETVTSYTSDIYNYIATDQDIDVSEIIPEETNQEPTITNLLQVYNSDENQTYAFQVEASDPEGDTIYYSLSGVDKEFFDINVTGLIKFKEAPDYENPLDSGKDNTYKINIDVSDSLTSSTNSNLNTQTSNSFSSNGNPDIKPSSNSLESNNSVNATEVHITNIDEDLIDLVFNTTDGTSSAAPTISIDMQIDELTKASEVHVLTWLKDSAQTWYYATKNDSLNWSINETLNKYASAGTYEIRQVLIRRNDLDDLTIVDTALKEKGFDIDAVIANSNSDSINPELKGVDSITVSGNDGDAETNIIVTIVISVEDNESGVEKAFSYIKGPGGEITGSWGTLNEEKNKVTFTFTLDPRTGSGTYTIDDIRITDNAGNEKIYTNSEISGLSFTNSWSITNQISDNQAPNIIALSLTPSLNASDLNRKQITIDITTDDQVTDINDIYIRLINPDNANIDQYIVADGRLFTTTKNGNKYSHTISLPLEYPDGTYTISYIFINDKALNNKQYSAAELSELGFDTSVIFGQVANSSPVFTSNSSFTVAENQTSAATITVTDADSDSISFSLSGTDADSFAIASSGALTFNNAPDYETKESYSLIVSASDGTSSESQTITITISNVNEVPLISALSSTQSPDENQTSIVTVSASDPDANTSLTYSVSGTDSSLFSISSSGVLTFKTAPDYETPGDANGDNNYKINVVVSDGSLSVTQAITIQVQNVADLISGVAVDGYVAGATVFQDLNNDGDLDSGEPSAATNSLGSFSLNLSSVNINAPVRIYNGFDLASNEIHPSIMDISVSETGSYIVTPISTLVGRLKIEDTSLTAMVPQSMIAGALGISLADSPNDSILGFDPIAYFNGSDATLASEARPVFAASQLLMTMGGGNYSVHKYITDQVLSSLSSTLSTAAGSSITLSSANDILGLKQDAYDAIFNGYVDTTLANNPPINSIQFRNNKAVMTDYLNGSSSSAVNYSLYGVHDGTTTLVADLVGAKLDYDNLKQILDNDGTGTPMDLNFELANIPAAGSGSTGVTLKLFMGADTTQASDEDYLQIALTANWESDGTNFKIKLPASSSITASFFDRSGTTLSITPTNQVEDIFTVTQDGPNRPATLSLRLSKLFNVFPSEVTGLSSFLDGAAQFTYLVEFDNFSIYDHLDNTFTKIQGTFEVDANPGITVFADDIYVHENATSKDISFYLSQAASSDVTLDYAIADASTASSSDYTLSSGTVTIPAGSMSATLTIPVTNDTTVEAQEEIRLTLSNVQNAVLGRSSVSAFITDGEEILANSTQKAILADNIFKDSKASINAYIKNKLDTSTVTISGISYTYSQVLINNSVTTDVYAYLDSIIDDYEVLSETLISTIMTKADAYIDAQLSSFADYTAFATGLTQLNSGIKGLNMSQIVGTNINSNGTFPSGQNATTLQTALDGKVDTLVTLAADTVADILGTDTNTNFPNANVVMGTDGDDTITGTSGSDLIASFNGTDTVNGLAGNDKILGGAGVDTLNGGDNDDHLYGYAGADTLNGNAGDDLIYGGKDDDTINGGAGDDDLRGEAGNDTINSGSGVDILNGGLGNDTLKVDGTGNKTINGSAGTDSLILNYSGITNLGNFDISQSGDSISLTHNSSSDTITFSNVANLTVGSYAYTNDTSADTYWNSSEYVLYMYSGGNTSSSDITSLSGFSASANLAVVGSASADTMNLNLDRASAFTGNWTIDLKAGDDTLNSAKLKNADSIDMGAGDDTISLMLTGSNGTNTIANANLTKLDGGAGWDTLSFYESGASTTALTLSTANATNFEGIIGSSGAETITGDANDNYLNGGGGSSDTANDTLNGEAGNDMVMAANACSGCSGDKYAFMKQYWPYANNYTTEGVWRNGSAVYWTNDGDHTLNGGAGDDILIGAEGEDTLTGGTGQDNLIGGRGIDTFVIKAGDGSTTLANADVIQDFKDGTDLIGMDSLTFDQLTIAQGSGNYSDLVLVSVTSGGEYLAVIHTQGQNGAGNITSSNITALDFVSTSTADQTINGTTGNDTLIGGSGADTFNTSTGTDSVYGHGGNDTINVNGSGSKVIHGGSGTDTLVISYSGITKLGDFTISESGDYIVLTYANGDTIQFKDVENLTVGSYAYTNDTSADTYWNSSEYVLYMYSGGNTSSSDITSLSGFSASTNLSVMGSASADTMNLNLDRASAFTGNWTIDLKAGDDTLNSAKLKNADSIDMGAGYDSISLMLTGSNGTNTIANANLAKLDGGAGFDTLFFEESGASTTALTLSTANATNFEGIVGTDGAETITGDANDNFLAGGNYSSSDSVNDTLNGGDGNDMLMASYGCSGCSGDKYAFVKQYWPYANNYTTEGTFRNGSATYWQSGGDHTLNGGAGDDLLFGAEGEDTLNGGTGQDNLIGGRGIDTFVIRAGDGSTDIANTNVIQDFKDGTDLIGMADDLQYNDLTIEQGNGDYSNLIVIKITSSGEYLAVIHTQGQNGEATITESNIDSNDFSSL